jgi:hypothetical protein
VHAVFLGFTVSMIFAHAPVILPAVLHRPLPYHPAMYVPAILLHAALLLRVAGDLRGARLLWQVGGVGNVVAVLAFLVTAIAAAMAAGRRRGRRPGAAGGTAAVTGPAGDGPATVPDGVPQAAVTGRP